MVKVEIDLPQQIHDFLRALAHFAETGIMAYCVDAIVRAIDADVNVIAAENKMIDESTIRAKYGLDEVDP